MALRTLLPSFAGESWCLFSKGFGLGQLGQFGDSNGFGRGLQAENLQLGSW